MQHKKSSAKKHVDAAPKNKNDYQLYDNTLKALFGDEAAEIISTLLPEAELVHENNIEIDRTKLKADLVYNTLYKGEPATVNMELQTEAEEDMEVRLLQYHAGLKAKHGHPVISVIIYPFETALQEPPYVEQIADEVLLFLNYRVVCLWKEDAEHYVQAHKVCMYTLLPGMQHATAQLLKQALQEMAHHYRRSQLGHHLIRFRDIMWRANTMTLQDKLEIEEVLFVQYNFDEFIDNNPLVIERMEKSKVAGITEGEILAGQKMVLDVIRSTFPSLIRLAQARVPLMQDPDELRALVIQIMKAPDETAARALFRSTKKSD